jgi:hypothetical protein
MADPDAEAGVLRRLLSLQLAQVEPPTPDPGLRAAYFLLDYDPGGIDAEQFATVVLERLLRQISRRTQQRQEQQRGRVRGRVDWAATVKARYGKGGDPSVLICREPYRVYDTPENQLLRFMVEQIIECLHRATPSLRQGRCYLPGQARTLESSGRLARMEAALAQLRGHVVLRSIPMPAQIVPLHLLRATSTRAEDYAAVATLYRRYRAAVDGSGLAGLRPIGRRVLPLPATLDDAAEVPLRVAAGLLRASGP